MLPESEYSNNPAKLFELWRQDDNGCIYLICRYRHKEEAEKLKLEFENSGHKQIYWIKNLQGESR